MVTAANPHYVNPTPNGDPIEVVYGFGNDVGPLKYHGHVDSVQSTLGFEYQFAQRWSLRSYMGHAFETQQMVVDDFVDENALAAFLAPSEPTAPAFNPFGAGGSNDPSVIASIRSRGFWRYDSSYSYANASLNGQLFLAPAGPVTATIGADYRRQRFSARESGEVASISPPGVLQRSMGALFAEVEAPLIRGETASGRVGRLGVSAGARLEHFDAWHGVFAPQIGLSYAPTSSLTLTATWARWFRPPNLPDISEANNLTGIVPLADPAAPAGYSSALVEQGGNSKLRPERAQSLNLGMRFVPLEWPEFSLSLKYFDVLVHDRIYAVRDLPDSVLSDPQFGWLVNRAYTETDRSAACSHGALYGTIEECLNSPISALVDMRLRNVSRLRSSGFDWDTKLKVYSNLGWWNFGVDGTYFLRYQQADTPSSSMADILNTAHNPIRLRFRGLVGWSRRALWVSSAANFQGRYWDTDSPTLRPVHSWTTFDLVIGLALRNGGYPTEPRTRISLNIFDVFNSTPPVLFSSYGIAYDQQNGSLVARRISLLMQTRW
jgi:iron complex outermembrane recepter protein